MFEQYIKPMIAAARKAAVEILKIYNGEFEVEIKDDDSPVTLADKTADKLIKEELAKQFPSFSFLTEESEDDPSRLDNDYVFIIDPVDGTKEFICKNDQFTTNIALAYKHEVVVGVVMIPATNEIYYASKHGGAFYVDPNGIARQINVSDKTSDLTCLLSVHHFTEDEKKIIEKHSQIIRRTAKYGSSIKPCMIARGEAEISYRMSPYTKEWDTAAPQIVVEEAGGYFLNLKDLNPITYNKKDVYNRDGYIIVNNKKNILL